MIIMVGLEKIAVVAFLVISLLTFIAGFVCGHYFGRKSKQPSRGTPAADYPSSNQLVPLYEDVNELPNAVEHQEQGLELMENVNMVHQIHEHIIML